MRPWSLVITGLCLVIGFQNCSKFVLNPTLSGSNVRDFASTGGSQLQPSTDRLDPLCMSKSEYDACVFFKNPVASRGGIYSKAPATEVSFDTTQAYGVRLTGISKTGRLENSTIRIETLTGQPVSTHEAHFRYPVQNDSSQMFSQVMTYYWLTRTTEYLAARTGVFFAKDKSIRVLVDDTMAGWSPKTNSIHLKIDSSGNKMAWNGDLSIYFLGQANLYHATDGKISNLGTAATSKHRDCGLSANGCCTLESGCARALASGVGDYTVAMMFPSRPTLGETWVNRVEGLGHCSVNRDLMTLKSLSASSAFSSCQAQSGSGEVTIMGSVYASVWWDLRNQAATSAGLGAAGQGTGTQGAADAWAHDIDTLFMHHLPLLDGSDDFLTAWQKIKSVDSRLFGGKYSQSVDAQFRARGL